MVGAFIKKIMLSNNMFRDKITKKNINEFSYFGRTVPQDTKGSSKFRRKNIATLALSRGLL
jgi:hypothetical protein